MLLKSMDQIISLYCPESKVKLVFANVTDTARTLERNHLCGPIAGIVQAELVGGAALMGTLLDTQGQSISLRVQLPEGLLGGATVECAYGYTIRGYTRRKVLPDLDDNDDPDETLFDRAMGRSAHCAVIRSDAHGGTSNAVFDLNYKDRLTTTDIVEEYFNTSLQRRALVQLSAASKLGYVECAHALLCDFLPEATNEEFNRISAIFDSGDVQDALDAGKGPEDIAALLGLGTPNTPEEHPVSFFCPCSSDRVVTMLKTLPKADLEEMAAADKPTEIYCHMCGKCYTITQKQAKSLL